MPKTEHEKYQEKQLPTLKRMVGLERDAEISLPELIKKLVEKGGDYVLEAVELLFATRRQGLIVQDQVGFMIYMNMWTGQDREYIVAIAKSHEWRDNPHTKKGFAIKIYPDEWFVIYEPMATELINKLR